MELFKLIGKIIIDGLEDASEGLEKIANKAKSVGEKISSAGDKITGIGQKMLPVTTAIGGVGVATGKMAIEFDDAMANINTLLDDESHLEGYRDTVKSISNETGLDIETMTSGMYQAISSLGDGGSQTEKIFETMARAAKAGGAEVSDSVALISAGMKGYNEVNSETAQKISDLAFQTAKLGVTTFPEMAKSMQPLFPLANSLNLSYEDLFGSMATLTGVTGNTAEVSTQLKAVFSNLMTPTTAMSKLIEKYGYASGQAMLESEGFAGMLKIVQKETGGQADKMAELFSSVEAVTAMTALTGSQFDTFNEKLSQMSDATGATETAYEKLETTGDKLRKSWNQLKNTGMELGETLIEMLVPFIEKVSEKVEELSKWWNGLDDTQKQSIVRMAGIVAAIAPVLMIIGKLTSGIGSLVSMGGSLVGGIGKVTGKLSTLVSAAGTASGGLGGLGSALGAIASPVGIVVAAIAALAGAFAYLWNTNEDFRTNMTNTWNEIVSTCSPLLEDLKNAFMELWQNVLQPFLQFVAEKLAPVFEVAFSLIGEQFSAFLTVATGIIEFLTGIFTGDWEKAWQGVQKIFEGIWQGIESIVDVAIQFIQNCLTLLSSFLSTILENIKTFIMDKISAALNFVIEKFNSLPDPIKNVLSVVIGFIVECVKSIIEKIQTTYENIQKIFNVIKTFISTIMNNIWSTISSKLESIKTTFSTKLSSVVSAVEGKFQEIIGGIQEKMASAKKVISDALDEIKGFFDKLELKLPEIKLPHFKVEGEFDLAEGKVPTMGVEWYAKGAVLSKPTIFGMNGNNAMVGGESGAEAVAPIDVLKGYVAEAVASQNEGIVEILEKILIAILSMNGEMKESFIEALQEMRFSIGNREFARLVKAVN